MTAISISPNKKLRWFPSGGVDYEPCSTTRGAPTSTVKRSLNKANTARAIVFPRLLMDVGPLMRLVLKVASPTPNPKL